MKCIVFDCQKEACSKNLCSAHYRRLKYHTDPEYKKMCYESNKRWQAKNRNKMRETGRKYRNSEHGKIVCAQAVLRYDMKHPELFYINRYRSRNPGGRCPDLIAVRKSNYERMMRVFVRSYK